MARTNYSDHESASGKYGYDGSYHNKEKNTVNYKATHYKEESSKEREKMYGKYCNSCHYHHQTPMTYGAWIHAGCPASYSVAVGAVNESEEAFLEGYYAALNEISSTQKYLNHHSIPGDILGSPLEIGINSTLKRHPNNLLSASKLYGRYIDYCENTLQCKPLPRETFIKECNKYYTERGYGALIRFLGSMAAGATSPVPAISSARAAGASFGIGVGDMIYRRTDAFKRNTGMIDDID